MADNVTLKIDLSAIKDFKNFVKTFRKEIIETGLDKPIGDTIGDLKTQLKFVVNEQILTTPTDTSGNSNKTNELGQKEVNPPKSESELLKHLTNGKADVTKYNKSKDFTTLNDSGLIFAHPSKGQDQANRITLRMDISPEETVSSQKEKARQFFQEAVFAIPDLGGDIRYYVNPGIDLSDYVKIKCSIFTGDGSVTPKKGMSPQSRFIRNSQTKGYADWTLKQEAVSRIRTSFIDISEIIDLLKDGDYDRAKIIIQRVDRNNKLDDMTTQIDKLKANQSTSPTTKAYTNSIALINNIRLVKKVSKEGVIYNLLSNYDEFDSKDVNFFDNMMNALTSWTVQQNEDWFQQLVTKVSELIKKFESNGL